jgi:hypothetical protein
MTERALDRYPPERVAELEEAIQESNRFQPNSRALPARGDAAGYARSSRASPMVSWIQAA